MFKGFLDYFPLAVAEVARLSLASNEKHNPGEPLHWSKDKSNDHLDCLARHLLEAGKEDTDGFLHDVKVAWRALANLQTILESDDDAVRLAQMQLEAAKAEVDSAALAEAQDVLEDWVNRASGREYHGK